MIKFEAGIVMLAGHRSFLFLTALFVMASLQAQNSTPGPVIAPRPTFQSNVRVVVVDVVVTTNKDEPVSGLHKQDFQLFENGKPQTASTFEEHKGASVTEIKLPPMPPHVYTNYPLIKPADSVNVLLLDALNTPTQDQTYVHSRMIKYLKTIPPGTRIAIFTLASRLRMLQGVTSDSSTLLAVLNKNGAASPHQSPLLASTVENDSNQRLIDFLTENEAGGVPQTLAEESVNPIMAMREFLADTAAVQTESRIRLTLQSFQQLARYLSDVPGRKNVLWFAGSFPVEIFPDTDLANSFTATRNFEQDIRKTADQLTSSDVAIYPIGAEGLASDSLYQVSGMEIGEKRPSYAIQDQARNLRSGGADRDSNHAAMEELAKSTGGRAFYNTNGLGDVLTRVIDSGSHYYTLTYTPSDQTMDGRYRRIEVKLPDSKYKLAYRRGYYADDSAKIPTGNEKSDGNPLLPLMGRNLPDYAQIVYKIRVLPSNPQPPADAPRIGSNTELTGPFTRYGVDFAVAVQDLKLDAAPDGVRSGNIIVMLIAYNREGKPLNLVVSRSKILLQPKIYESMKTIGLQLHKEIDVPRGDAFLRVGIYDLAADTAGTLGVELNDAALSANKTPK